MKNLLEQTFSVGKSNRKISRNTSIVTALTSNNLLTVSFLSKTDQILPVEKFDRRRACVHHRNELRRALGGRLLKVPRKCFQCNEMPTAGYTCSFSGK
ncbi:MAG: hypothetical protein LBV26_01755 [Bacteroidales bacterium]|jgi:hypothetical protein|nr:hypothetical protein [Bacteroidales bacterium]